MDIRTARGGAIHTGYGSNRAGWRVIRFRTWTRRRASRVCVVAASSEGAGSNRSAPTHLQPCLVPELGHFHLELQQVLQRLDPFTGKFTPFHIGSALSLRSRRRCRRRPPAATHGNSFEKRSDRLAYVSQALQVVGVTSPKYHHALVHLARELVDQRLFAQVHKTTRRYQFHRSLAAWDGRPGLSSTFERFGE